MIVNRAVVACVALVVTLLVPPAAAAQPAAEQIFEAIGARPGSSVCEIGAGDGRLSIAAAKAVGPDGRVYTSELGESRLQRLRAAVDASGLGGITVVEGHGEKTNFPDGACDALFMRDVYHHFTNAARMNAAIFAAMKPGARIAIVDFVPPGEEAPPENRAKDGTHGVYPETVERELKEAGFDPVSSDRGTRWFVVVLAKPSRRGFATDRSLRVVRYGSFATGRSLRIVRYGSFATDRSPRIVRYGSFATGRSLRVVGAVPAAEDDAADRPTRTTCAEACTRQSRSTGRGTHHDWRGQLIRSNYNARPVDRNQRSIQRAVRPGDLPAASDATTARLTIIAPERPVTSGMASATIRSERSVANDP